MPSSHCIKAGILEAATLARIKFPNMCNVGECGTCRCRLREGSVKLKRDITHHISIAEIEEGYILGCQAVPEGDVVVQVPGLSATDDSTSHTAGKILSLKKLTHDILEVNVALDHSIHYVAGQYAQLSVADLDGMTDIVRNYSFSSPVTRAGTTRVQFYIRHVPGGLFTDWLFAADRTGASLQITAPFGDFHYHASERPLLCIAGGSGLAPLKAMLEQMRVDDIARPVTFLFGAREQRDLYCMEAINALAASWPASFALHPILSNEADFNWNGRRGFVTGHIERIVPDLADYEVYLCGPPAMLDAAIAHVASQVPRERIHFDRFLDQSSIMA